MKKIRAAYTSVNALRNFLNSLAKPEGLTIDCFVSSPGYRGGIDSLPRVNVKFSGGKLGPRTLVAAGRYTPPDDGETEGKHEVDLSFEEKQRYKAHLKHYISAGGLV